MGVAVSPITRRAGCAGCPDCPSKGRRPALRRRRSRVDLEGVVDFHLADGPAARS